MNPTVNLALVCKELKALLADDNVSVVDKISATEAFKEALWKKLGFSPDVTKWDAVAVNMYLDIMIEIS